MTNKIKTYRIKGSEPSCPKCKMSNALLNSRKSVPYDIELECRDCGFVVKEKDLEIKERDININISNISKGEEKMPEAKKQVKVKSLTGVKNALLKHKKVWLTLDEKEWIYAEYNGKTVWINFGMDSETASFHVALNRIYDFLTFKRSIDMLGQ